MQKIFLLSIVALFVATTYAQAPLKTRDGQITFNANKHNTADYAGTCTEATAVFNPATGDVAFLMPVKTIHFPNALLEEHVNENYLESNKYPNVTFKGKLGDFNASMLQKDGAYVLHAEGSISMHGMNVPFKTDKVNLEVKSKTAIFKVVVNINYKDYKISVPSTVEDKIAMPIAVQAVIKFNL